MELFGIWIAAFLTLCIYSFLYRDNPFYRFAEHLFVGVSLGYSIVLSIHQAFIPLAWQPLWAAVTGEAPSGLIKLIPIGIGLLFFSALSPRQTWLIRYPSAILIGIGSGLSIPNVLRANIFEQTRGTVEPFAAVSAGTLSGFGVFEAVLMVVGVLCTLTYFFFSVEHRGPRQVGFKGRYCLSDDRVRFSIWEHSYGTCCATHSTDRFSAKRLAWFNFLTTSPQGKLKK